MKNTKVKDHLGNTYKSEAEMCREYHISQQTYRARVVHGWKTEDALTTPVSYVRRENKPSDHKGNLYETAREMCAVYGIPLKTYRARIQSGWSKKRALETPVRKNKIPPVDHHGRRYSSISGMCRVYHVRKNTFVYRMEHGWSLEDALTEKPGQKRKRNFVKDHLGNSYKNTEEMCKKYGIKPCTYYYRRKTGMSQKAALTMPVQEAKAQTDHLGNQYVSTRQMCIAYGITQSQYEQRMERGWGKERALTEKSDRKEVK